MATFNPFTESFRVDPYPHLHTLRSEDPVHKSNLGFWVLTRFDDIESVLKNPTFRIAEEAATGRVGAETLIGRISSRAFLFLNPPDHTRIRGAVSSAFSPARVARLRPGIRRTARELIGSFKARGSTDLIGDFAYRLPIATICDLVGVPKRSRERVHEWSEKLAIIVDPVVPADAIGGIEVAASEFSEFVKELIFTKEAAPGQDLISDLVTNKNEEQALTQEEIIATCFLLLIAGHDTTTGLIGNGVLALTKNPKQLASLRKEPERMSKAVEEMLRFDSPVQVTFRWPSRDTLIGERLVQAGERVALLLGAANRDPARFDNPDTFEISRQDIGYLSFGSGILFCLGAHLARAQTKLAFSELLESLGNIRVAGEPVYRSTITLRTLSSLPVEFSERRSRVRRYPAAITRI